MERDTHMSETISRPQVAKEVSEITPLRMHHFNFACRDHEATRAFYEGLLGFPLVAFWCEVEPSHAYGGKEVVMGHAFYAMADGSLLAFMHHGQAEIREPILAQAVPETIHLALHVTPQVQADTVKKLRAAGHKVLEIDHGFCKSMYFKDPNGLTVEYTMNHTNHDEIWGEQKAGLAAENMRRYVQGDYTKTNKWFPEEPQVMEFR